jgi:glutaredoxin
MDKIVILYTMDGCPFCSMMKDKLNEEQIKFYERDIDEHKDEYDMFVEITENDYVPAFMIIESEDGNPKSNLYAPDRDFNDIETGVNIIKESLSK